MGLIIPGTLGRFLGDSGGGGYSFYGVTGARTAIDARNPANTVSGGVCSTAADLTGNGNHWTKDPTVAGLPTITATVTYPDVAGNTMVSLPSVTAFNVLSATSKMLRCSNIMTGLTNWTVVSVQKTVTWDTNNDKPLYWLDHGRLQANGGNGAGYFYNGTTYGTNSAGLGVAFDSETQWRVTIQSYTAPAGGNTSRHFIMQNGLVSVITKNVSGALDSDPLSANFAWPTATNEYLPRSDYNHLALGTVSPVSLSQTTGAPRHVTLMMALFPRGLTLAECGTITNNILNELYATAPPFMRVLHCMGDSLHAEGGGLSCVNGFYWQDLAAVKKAATSFFNTAEGGNTIEVQRARARATAGRAQRVALHKEYVANVMVGTNNPTDDANGKWTKVKTMLTDAMTTNAITHINVGELLACGTSNSVTNPDTGRCAAHDAYNVVMRAGMTSGGDFYTANPTIGCNYLAYATSIPAAFEVPIAVLNPATAVTTYNTQVAATMPSDTANASQYHYQADGLHPKTQIRPNGTLPIYSRVGMYEVLGARMNATYWP